VEEITFTACYSNNVNVCQMMQTFGRAFNTSAHPAHPMSLQNSGIIGYNKAQQITLMLLLLNPFSTLTLWINFPVFFRIHWLLKMLLNWNGVIESTTIQKLGHNM
jgi:hypothetical protein